MKIWKLARSNDIILPQGTVLYHGTGEQFDASAPRVSGYDKIFWTTESKAIAKTYIPVAHGMILTDSRHIASPSTNPTIINIQKAIGIVYDTSSFKMRGIDIDSWRSAPVFAEERFWNDENAKCEYVTEKMKTVFNYIPEYDQGCYTRWRVKIGENNTPQKSDYRLQGRLFSVKLNRAFKIWDKTEGGATEGDLMDVDYHKIDLFRLIEKKGYDGIKINDFCQSEDHGNVGHTSIGLFNKSLKDVSITSEVAEHELLAPYFKGLKEW
jgi:hypothetical protein